MWNPQRFFLGGQMWMWGEQSFKQKPSESLNRPVSEAKVLHVLWWLVQALWYCGYLRSLWQFGSRWICEAIIDEERSRKNKKKGLTELIAWGFLGFAHSWECIIVDMSSKSYILIPTNVLLELFKQHLLNSKNPGSNVASETMLPRSRRRSQETKGEASRESPGE